MAYAGADAPVDVGADARALLQSPGHISPKAVLTALINSLTAVPTGTVLILDDYHVIQQQSIHDALAFLLDNLPSTLHLVISTRADPPLPLARMRARGHLAEIRAADLRFTPGEAAAFLNDTMGLDLSAEDVAALGARTEGWIAGLHLAALSMRGIATPRGIAEPRGLAARQVSDFIAAFSGSNRHVIDYLAEEVLAQQPKEIRDFLIHTSILDRLTAPLCDAVLGMSESANRQISKSASQQISKSADEQVSEPANQRISESAIGSQELHQITELAKGRWGDLQICDLQICTFADCSSRQILHYLDESNLFVVPLDHHRHWYRYHHLFADLLRNRLHQDLPGRVPELHRRASEWYERNGLAPPAIDHVLSAGDFERAADLIEQAADATLMRSETATFLRWVQALPDQIVRARPLLSVYLAGMQLLSGHPLEAAEARLEQAEEIDTAGAIAGEIAVFQALIASYRGDSQQSTAYSQRALDILPEEKLLLRSLVAGLLGLNCLYSGDIAAARPALEEAARIGRKAGNLMNTVLALCHLAEISVVEGQLHEAQAFYDQAVQLATDFQGHHRPIAGMALIGLGELLREWNDLESATRHLTQGIELTGRWAEAAVIMGHVTLARVRQAQGDAEGAQREMQAAQRVATRFDAMDIDDFIVSLHQARLWVAQGNLEAAIRWVEDGGLEAYLGPEGLEGGTGVALSPYLRALEQITRARVTIAQRQPGAALQVLRPLIVRTEAAGWMGIVVEALVLESLALQAQDDRARAVAALERALSLAEPEGYVRLFVDEGTPMARLLRHALSQGIAPAYVTRLLATLDKECSRFQVSGSGFAAAPTSNLKPETMKPETHPLESLSARELEVLRLVAAGLSNREIAEELTIAVGTAKRHVSNIYAKLDVHSRTQAVAKAQDLHML